MAEPKLLVLLLLVASANGFTYFVKRSNGAGVCISNKREQGSLEIFPIAKLDGSDGTLVGGETRSWANAWKMENMNVRKVGSPALRLEYRTIVTGGSDTFLQIRADRYFNNIFALAANATILLTSDESWRGSDGIRVNLDMLVPESGLKQSTATFCRRMGTRKESCFDLDLIYNKAGRDGILSGGRRWSRLTFNLGSDIVTLLRDSEQILQWKKSGFSNFDARYVFTRTYQQPGIFKLPFYTHVTPMDERDKNRLSRTLSAGRQCIMIEWDGGSGEIGKYSLKDAMTGKEIDKGSLIARKQRTRLRLQPSKSSTLFLFELMRGIDHIGPCPGELATGNELDVFGPATLGCSVFEDFEGYVKPSTTLSVDSRSIGTVSLNEEQMTHVCSTLGFSSNDETEDVNFCSRYGCKYESCPPEPISWWRRIFN